MHKASRVYEMAPSATPEGGEDRRPSIPAREPAVASPKAREIAVTRRSGPEHAELPPMNERPAVGGKKKKHSTTTSNESRKNERRSVVGESNEPGMNRGPQDARTRTTEPPVDEQRTTWSSGRHAPSRPLAGEPGTEATRRRRRKTKQHQSGWFSI